MPIKIMTVSQWIKVPDNPIQRDTERHAARAKHLLTPLSIHAITYAAELPDGALVKLDGHTRALLWKRNQVRHPPHVECNIIAVDSMEEAMALYRTIDTKEALETIGDKVSGAFGLQKYAPTSGLMKGGGITTALRVCWAILHGIGPQSRTEKHIVQRPELAFDVYKALPEFLNEVMALDSFGLGQGQSTMGLTAAFILTYRKHSARIIPFWQAIFGDGGTKVDGKMDGVQAVRELMLQRKGRGGGTAPAMDLCARVVMGAERWLEDRDFTAIPRPYDMTNYIKGIKPSVILIKKDHNHAAA